MIHCLAPKSLQSCLCISVCLFGSGGGGGGGNISGESVTSGK